MSGRDLDLLEGLLGERTRAVRMRLGAEALELTEYAEPKGRPYPADTRSNDRWFQHAAIIVSNMDRAYARLRDNHVEHASTAPQRLPDWNPNAGGIRAFYFRDPDRHFLEILQFPPGKGDTKWHRPSDRLFLGIDHTAIVVFNTDDSLKFYRDGLGLRVAGESDNYGIEQERLSNVAGAHVRITSLRAAAGPGIELLEYLAPRDGRSTPADLRVNDIASWETTLSVEALDGAAALPVGSMPVSVAAGAVPVATTGLGFDKGLVVRDPDGHRMRLVATARK